VTAFGLLFTPTFYVVCRHLANRFPGRPRRPQHESHALEPAE